MNPELRRLLWLELTPTRVGSVLAMVVAMLVLGWLVDGRDTGATTSTFALAGFVIFTIAWGAMQVSASMLDERRLRTWDQQRMSALSPLTAEFSHCLNVLQLGSSNAFPLNQRC